jgi:2-haloacid dehalogenase
MEPAELMLVAARRWRWRGARRTGLRTAFADRTLEYGPGLRRPRGPAADESVINVRGLIEVVEA